MKYLLTLFLIFFPLICSAQGILPVGSCVNSHAASCDPDTNEVGDRDDSYSDSNDTAEGGIKCMLFAADCTGTANTGMLYRVDGGTTDTDNCKIGLCNSSDGSTEHSPASHDDGCVWSSGNTITGTEDWINMTGDLGIAVTNGSYYWVCVAAGAGGCRTKYKASSGSKKTYSATGFTYSSLPANLDGTWTETAARNRSYYVEID